MSHRLIRLGVRNFRALAHVDLELDTLNVFFGPNGSGKSTLLDVIWFVRDCAVRGVDLASSDRSHGIGALWDGEEEGAHSSFTMETESAVYEVLLGYSSGRMEPFPGEKLYSRTRSLCLIDRKIGSDKAQFYHSRIGQTAQVTLREPEKLAFTTYLDFEQESDEAAGLAGLLRNARWYPARLANLYGLKKFGSEAGYQTRVWDRGQNLWSVLRNLDGSRGIDDRYETIIGCMRRAFPSFKDLFLEPTGPNTVYGHFIEKGLREPIKASGVSDGHLQMLIHLTALFSEGRQRESLLLFDEPETSLHPYAISVLAEAFRIAAEEWNKQVLVATHSPVLISQFDPEHIVAAEKGEFGQNVLTRVSTMTDIKDLLEQYAAGSLYMAEVLAPQSKRTAKETDQ